jgi:hypothetical protein
MKTEPKLIFGFPVAERFIFSRQLYYSIKKFCRNPLVLFSSNQDIGYSFQQLKKIISKRKYGIRKIQNFLFDIFEEINGRDFDYFVKLDSDCLFANYGLEKIFAEEFDFLDSVDDFDHKCKWDNARPFLKNIEPYKKILSDLKLSRIDSRISGCLCAFQIYSKEAVNFITGRIGAIENNPGYLEMIRQNLCLSELIVPNLLKDAGFKYKIVYLHEEKTQPCWNIRWRPYINKDEVETIEKHLLPILYHPLKRSLSDKGRRILLKKIGYRYSLRDIIVILPLAVKTIIWKLITLKK